MSFAGHMVSVIIPTRNSARTLESCLQSIRSQTYEFIEVIVVDNGSTDRTRDIARFDGAILDYHGPERSAQRNRGAHLAHGEWLLFVDSDMRLGRNVVAECMDLVRESGAAAVVIPEESVGEGFLAEVRKLERSCYVGDDSIEAARFFSRSTFDYVGGFDEQLIALEDWDLAMRVSGGRTLPRTFDHILHDEGKLRLATLLAKKRYYGPSFVRYWRKHRGQSLGQANLVFRPAFARNWRRLVRHPLLAGCVLVVKALESGAAIWGLLEACASGRYADADLSPTGVK